jgi:hypothetical protein
MAGYDRSSLGNHEERSSKLGRIAISPTCLTCLFFVSKEKSSKLNLGNAYSAYPFPFLCETFGAQPVYVGANLISWFHQPQDSDKVATPKMPELMNCLCVETPAVPQNDTMAVDPMNYQKWAIRFKL